LFEIKRPSPIVQLKLDVPGWKLSPSSIKSAHHLAPGDAHGHAPLFMPVNAFLPSHHHNKVDRFVNWRELIGPLGFAVQSSPIRAPLDRFRVGLMAEIPARENFKNTKTQKTCHSQISLGPREKLLGRAGLVFLYRRFSFRSQKMILSAAFRGSKRAIFAAANRKAKNVSNCNPRKGGFKIIFKLREENL
jgi:hypothetical protein